MPIQFHFKVEKIADNFVATCVEQPLCKASNLSREDLLENLSSILKEFLINNSKNNSNLFPLAKGPRGTIKVPVDPNIGFALLLRSIRVKRKLSQQQAAVLIGMKHLYNYQRLESPAHANPSLSTLGRIKHVFPELKFDQIF
ncbi:XRE family transcriptional regulator [Leptospira langatensis]|uniref:XRE family transcriptional regulator n=1 Tax=Leptospira langatensis TaxID=2484983 RepID=A0A5R2ATT7_9LEPT|nr:helix-turn-helix transcriptional regulator [Leptospira langatensis]TGJ99869.1 XRE family transcriptional regulator [Leptospira langatensis]